MYASANKQLSILITALAFCLDFEREGIKNTLSGLNCLRRQHNTAKRAVGLCFPRDVG